ncbi:unnamed protein product [Oikopleura dioica]|uniref:Uncharacterized protein n=1 Tax=Oikopleura dioica TaxID=34765 RepID=E4X2E1_OIKDI|nr:unnamed protein product [Oikopleura dioica]
MILRFFRIRIASHFEIRCEGTSLPAREKEVQEDLIRSILNLERVAVQIRSALFFACSVVLQNRSSAWIRGFPLLEFGERIRDAAISSPIRHFTSERWAFPQTRKIEAVLGIRVFGISGRDSLRYVSFEVIRPRIVDKLSESTRGVRVKLRRLLRVAQIKIRLVRSRKR